MKVLMITFPANAHFYNLMFLSYKGMLLNTYITFGAITITLKQMEGLNNLICYILYVWFLPLENQGKV